MNLIRFVPFISIASALMLTSPAQADIFAFDDVAGFRACIEQDHLVETTKTKSGEQHRYFAKLDVQVKCIEAAQKKLKNETDRDVIREYVKVAVNNTHRANTIDLMTLLVGRDLASCNSDLVYETVLEIMASPRSDDKLSLFQRSQQTIGKCLKDKQFKSDFLEEQAATKNSYQYKNVCEVLKNAKLISRCLYD